MRMGRFDKLVIALLSGTSDQNFRFDDLVKVLISLGFVMRVKGSHHIFARAGVVEIVNIQPVNAKAKPYQVKQVRELIIKYKLWHDGTGVE